MALAVAVLSACEAPGLRVAAAPADAVLLVDGQRVENPDRLPHRYYGVVELRALPVWPQETVPLPHAPATARVRLPAPAPGWLFPFDLVIELLRRPFLDGADHEAELTLPANPQQVTGGFLPADLQELRARAHAARAAR